MNKANNICAEEKLLAFQCCYDLLDHAASSHHRTQDTGKEQVVRKVFCWDYSLYNRVLVRPISCNPTFSTCQAPAEFFFSGFEAVDLTQLFCIVYMSSTLHLDKV